MISIYHNPRCSKSREALKLLEESGKNFNTIKYLENPPTASELMHLIQLLKIKPIELVRTKEFDWKENFQDKELSDSEIISAMLKFPKLMERPIVVHGQKAAIGRPIENILEIL